jgi:hypothetical protein
MEVEKLRIVENLHDVWLRKSHVLLDGAAEPRHSSIVAQTKICLDSCAFFCGVGFGTAQTMRFGG